MPALNPLILKVRYLSGCSGDIVKINQPEPREKLLSRFKNQGELESLETQLHHSLHHKRRRETTLHGKGAPAGPKVWWSVMKIFLQQDPTIYLPSDYSSRWVYSWFKFFKYKTSLFFSVSGGREYFEVDNLLCISFHLNEYITFHFDLWLHLWVTVIYHGKTDNL